MIERKLYEIINEKLNKGKAIIINGPRQSGKTTLITHLIKQKSMDMLMLNGDDDNDRGLFNNVTLQQWEQVISSHKGIFIDEAQKINNIGRAVKLLIDNRKDLNIILTGSSSFAISKETEEPLTGRKYEYKLLPLSFIETSQYFGAYEEKKILPLRLLYGCYPEVVTTTDNKKEILKQLSDSYLYRDLLSYDGIRKSGFLFSLLKALALTVSSETSTNELSTLLGVSRTLVDSYIALLEQAFIIFPLTSFSVNKRNEIRKSKKYYFYDNGIRNAVINDFTIITERNDIGMLWENYIISEFIKKKTFSLSDSEFYFWRTTDQMEVDLVEKDGSKIKAYEIKWNPNKKSRITKAFTNRYPDAEIYTITPENYDLFLRL